MDGNVTPEAAPGALADPRLAANPAGAWSALVRRYYDGCSSGDVDLMLSTLHPDVRALVPRSECWLEDGGREPAPGALLGEGRRMREARWVVDTICAEPGQAVIEWSMWWRERPDGPRVVTRGAEWFTCQDGLIHEIRSYYQMHPHDTELDGFPYSDRGYSVHEAEFSHLHPEAGRS